MKISKLLLLLIIASPLFGAQEKTFYVRNHEFCKKVHNYDIDPFIRNMSPMQLNGFLKAGGILRAYKLSNGDFGIRHKVPGKGGGPILAVVFYGATKAAAYAALVSAAIGCAAATGGAAAAAGTALATSSLAAGTGAVGVAVGAAVGSSAAAVEGVAMTTGAIAACGGGIAAITGVIEGAALGAGAIGAAIPFI